MQKHNLLSFLLIFGSGVSVLNADSDDLLDQGVELLQQGARYATEMTKNSVNQVLTGIKNAKTPDLVDAVGQYPVVLDTDLNLGVYEKLASSIDAVVQGMKNHFNHVATLEESGALHPENLNHYLVDGAKVMAGNVAVVLKTTAEKYVESSNAVVAGSEALLANPFEPSIDVDKHAGIIADTVAKMVNRTPEQAWYNKAWNAEIAGYKDGGKYVIIGSAVVVTALVTAYYLGYFSKTVTIEQMVDDLIAQAQENPNVVIVQLPKILASCKDDHMKKAIFKYVLSNITLTPEIKKAFNC